MLNFQIIIITVFRHSFSATPSFPFYICLAFWICFCFFLLCLCPKCNLMNIPVESWMWIQLWYDAGSLHFFSTRNFYRAAHPVCCCSLANSFNLMEKIFLWIFLETRVFVQVKECILLEGFEQLFDTMFSVNISVNIQRLDEHPWNGSMAFKLKV